MKVNRQILDQYPEIESQILKYIFECKFAYTSPGKSYKNCRIKSIETSMFHKEKLFRVIYLDGVGTESNFDICLKYKHFNDMLISIIRDNKINQITNE